MPQRGHHSKFEPLNHSPAHSLPDSRFTQAFPGFGDPCSTDTSGDPDTLKKQHIKCCSPVNMISVITSKRSQVLCCMGSQDWADYSNLVVLKSLINPDYEC